MASFDHDGKKGRARFFFRFRDRQYNKTVPVATARDAERLLAKLEDAIKDVHLGRLDMPEGVDVVSFLLSGGKIVIVKGVGSKPSVATVGDVIEAYARDQPPHLEPSTLKMQAIHGRRILEIVKSSTPLAAFDPQDYASARSKAKHNGKTIHRDTIAKELKTFRQAWAWVASRVPGTPLPRFTISEVKLPKGSGVLPFMTWAEIETEISRGADRKLWDCLWLEMGQVKEMLEHARAAASVPFIHPMIAAAAYTGMRRSELCRSEVSDWRLEDGTVRARQKKRDRDRAFTTRDMTLHPELSKVMKPWLESHPGGTLAFCHADSSPVTWDAATYHFIATLAGSKWSVVRGFHVLRHSFASNLASAGVDQRIIDKWMGHSTSIRLRYMHLRPDDQRDAMLLL